MIECGKTQRPKTIDKDDKILENKNWLKYQNWLRLKKIVDLEGAAEKLIKKTDEWINAGKTN